MEKEQLIQIGCNYHTKWQKKPGMRFVLVDVKDGMARLITRKTGKDFWTKVSDLIFINTSYNKFKAKRKAKKMLNKKIK